MPVYNGEVVGGRCTYGSGSEDVFGKEDALGFNYEEVDKLVNITNEAIEGFAGDGVVSARAKLRSKTLVKDKLAGSLGGNGNSERDPRQLESPANNIEIASGNDQGDDRGIGNSGGTCKRDGVNQGWSRERELAP